MKSTRKLLVSSFLMIISCCLLFAGTTFAWFSDSVSSNNNIITAGNLDIMLDYSLDGENWAPVENDPILPAEDLWEPGFTRVVYFRITNNGTLSLKYTFNVNILQDNGAVNVAGDTFYLTNLLKYGSNVGTENLEKLADRAAYVAKSTNALAAKNTLAADQELVSKEVDYGWFALTMPTSVGNEANTKPGTTAPSFEIGFDLLAYQTNEAASKGEAAVPVASVKKAPVPQTLNIANVFDQSDVSYTIPQQLKDLLYVPTEDIKLETQYAFYATDTLSEALASDYRFWHADFVISFDHDVPQNSVAIAGQYDNLFTGKNWVVVSNSGFEMKANEPLRLLANTLGYINYEELSQLTEGFHCGAFDFDDKLAGTTLTVELRLYETTIDPSNPTGNKNEEVGEDAYIVIGKYTHTFAATPVSNASDLNEKLTNGGNVVLTDDVTGGLTQGSIYGTPTAVTQKGGVLDGNGHSIIVENPQYNGYAIETYGGTIKNLSITSTVGRGIVISSPKEDVLIENVTVDGPGYAINTTEHSYKKLTVINSTIKGWTSLAGLELASFVNCHLGENTSKYWQNNGYSQDYDRLIRLYIDTMFTNCTFEEGYYISLDVLGADCQIVLSNCTVNGVVLTAENYTSYITIELPNGRTLADCVVFQ